EHLQALLQSFETQIGELVEPDHPEVWETEAQREELGETPIPLLLPSQNLLLTALEIKPILSLVLFAETAIATESQINLQSDLPDLPPIRGEANALREVFHNLINNALKYTPDQGQIWVRSGLVHPQQSQLWQGIEIADTGYGIPTADQQHIFERHYRGVQAQGDIPGTGLGLAIVQELVAMMEGNLELISPNYLSQDKRYPGTTFRLWLKIAN
ncbi:MAG: sensor histidine kinase, partial [Microcystaceae cyanobacterium]